MSSSDDDRRVIEALRKGGADLSRPRNVRHYLYVPTQRLATSAVPRLQQLGFTAEARPAAQGSSQWLLLVSSTIVLSEKEIASLRQAFAAFAEKLGGEYDGWEAVALP